VLTECYVYYRDGGVSTDEFKYLFDYLFRYQLIDPGNLIRVRAVPAAKPAVDAAAMFEKAKIEYAAHSHPAAQEEFKARLKDVSFATIEAVYPKFSDIEIGMRDD
jgi:hypothetical protein